MVLYLHVHNLIIANYKGIPKILLDLQAISVLLIDFNTNALTYNNYIHKMLKRKYY